MKTLRRTWHLSFSALVLILSLVSANEHLYVNLWGGGSFHPDDRVSLEYGVTTGYGGTLTLYRVNNPEVVLDYGGPRNFNGTDDLDLERVRGVNIPKERDSYYRDVDFGRLRKGLYFAQLEVSDHAVATLISVSDLSLVVKSDQDSILTYTTSVDSGQPKRSMIYLLRDDRIYAEGLADNQGLTEFVVDQAETTFVAAQYGDTWAYSESYWRSWGVETSKIYVHTDRSVYRPSHTVFFKGTARSASGLAPLVAETAEVVIRDSEGSEILRQSYTTDDFGSFAGELDLAVEPPLGNYSIITTVAGAENYSTFFVEEFQKPEYRVTVSADEAVSVQGNSASFTIHAEYLFGGAVSGGQVNYSLVQQPHYRWRYRSRYGFYEDYTYSNYYGGTIIERGEGVLDENGDLIVEVNLPANPEDYQLSLQAGVTDEARREISASGSLIAYRSGVVLNVTSNSYAAEVGDAIQLSVQAEDIYGEPVSVAFDVEAVRNYWLAGDGSQNSSEQMLSGKTDDEGRAMLTVRLDQQGSYRFIATAKDSKGRETSADRYMWVSDGSRWYWAYDSLNITVDKPEYKVGETARFVIESPISDGFALVTLEGQELASYEVIKLDGSVLTYELPLTEEMTPNGFLSVTIVGDGNVYTQTAGFRVPPEDKFLNVEITSNADTYQPGEEGSFALRVSDHEGRGVKAQVALGLVDEAIYLLRPDNTPDIRGYFYGLRSNVVGTEISRWFYFGRAEPLADGMFAEMAAEPAAARQAMDEAVFAQAKEDLATADIREDFRDTILWLPAFETNDDGLGTTTVVFPDNLTEWRMTARVITLGDQVGQNSYNVVSTLPVIARLAAPRFFIKGDEASLRVIGQNNLEEDQNGQLSLQAEGLVIANPDPQQATLPAGQRASADFIISALSTGMSSVTASALTPAASDAMKLPIPVLAHGIREELAWAGSGSDSWSFDIPQTVDPNSLTGTLYLTPSLAAAVSPALSYLAGYPYGCTEQTMSRFLPSVLAAQAGDLAMLPEDIEENLDDIVQKGLKRLYDFQHDDGGWGFWQYDSSSLFISAYVLNGLKDAKDAGYNVRDYVMERGLEYLEDAVSNTSIDNANHYAVAEHDARSYAYYALARNDRNVDGIYDLSRISEMSAYGLALSALSFAELDRSAEGQLYLDALRKRVSERDTTAFWDTNAPRYWWNDDDVEATAFALEAFVRLSPEDPLIAKVVNWLLAQRQGARWVSTKDTAAVIKSALALAEVTEESSYDYQLDISLNGEVLESRQIQGQANQGFEVPLENLLSGRNQLSLAIDGEGTLYASSQVQFFAERDFIAPEDDYLAIQRSYERLKPVFDEEAQQVIYERSPLKGSATVGDYVLVTVTLDPREEDFRYVMVNEPLPAGYRVIENDQAFRVAGVNPRYGYDYYGWNYWYDGRDIRDERVDYYFTHLFDEVTFSYIMRAETPGSYSALPTQAWLMYEPEVRGVGTEARLSIQEEALLAQYP